MLSKSEQGIVGLCTMAIANKLGHMAFIIGHKAISSFNGSGPGNC